MHPNKWGGGRKDSVGNVKHFVILGLDFKWINTLVAQRTDDWISMNIPT